MRLGVNTIDEMINIKSICSLLLKKIYEYSITFDNSNDIIDILFLLFIIVFIIANNKLFITETLIITRFRAQLYPKPMGIITIFTTIINDTSLFKVLSNCN